MKKGVKACLVLVLILGGLCVAGVAIMAAMDFCPPEGPWPAPPWCDGSESAFIPFSLDSNSIPEIAAPLSFTVTVPANTPDHTIVYIEFFDENGVAMGLRQMEKKSDDEWSFVDQFIYQDLMARGSLQYRYNRDNLGYTAAEEFTPDSPTSFRRISSDDDLAVVDVVTKWRWMPGPGESLPEVEAHVIPFEPRVNGEAFQGGVLLADFWWDAFDALIPSTNARMKANNIKWVSISPTWDYTQTSPTPILGKVGFSYKDEQLDAHLVKLQEDGFEIFLQPQICCTIPSEQELSDEWWAAWLEQYRTFLFYNVEYANRYEIPFFNTDIGWFINDNIPPTYRVELEKLLTEVRDAYQGRMGREVYVGGNIEKDLYCAPVSDGEKWDFFAVKLWAGFSTRLDPSLDELTSNLRSIFDSCLAPVYTRYKKPFILTQVAYPSVDGGLQGTTFLDGEDPAISLWEPYSDKFQLDLEEQALGYDAMLQAVAQTDYIIGMYPFVYFPDTFPLSKEYNIRDKPAESVLSEWYESIP